jgi:hypothetical protein
MTWLVAGPHSITVRHADPTDADIQAALNGYVELLETSGAVTKFNWWVNDEGLLRSLPVHFLRKSDGLPIYGKIVGTCNDSFDNKVALIDEFYKLFTRRVKIEDLTNVAADSDTNSYKHDEATTQPQQEPKV